MSDEIAAEATIRTVIAGVDAKGERVDRFLAGALASLSRSRVKTLIEEGHASRDGVPLREPAELVREGASYSLALPAPVAASPRAQVIPFPILYEDADLLVLDKPPGLVVHPAPGNPDGTLVNALLAHCGSGLPGIGGERRPGIVHRLDKDTSGVMVVAKTEQALASLSAAFAARDLDRAYLALAWGTPNPAVGAIEGAIGRDPRERKRMAIVARGGKFALTHYRTVAHRDRAVALLECRLATGRTHQIRVHLAGRTRSSAIRSTCAASRRRRACCPRCCAVRSWISRGKRCTPPGWGSRIRAPGRHYHSRRHPRLTCRRFCSPSGWRKLNPDDIGPDY